MKLTAKITALAAATLLGNQPVFFTFSSGTEGKSICELHSFRFVRN